MQNTTWVGNKQFEHNMGARNNRNTEKTMQVRHAKLQARFSGNDESGKGLQQLEHVYVLAVTHELLKQSALIFNDQTCSAK